MRVYANQESGESQTMSAPPPTSTTEYDVLLDLVQNRRSIRKLKSDPVPDEYITKILDVGHGAMSGANSQPWEFIVVKDPTMKKELLRKYNEVDIDFTYWMEQQRAPELRHPSFQISHEEAVVRARTTKGWSEAPFLIVVLGDGRRQWGTVQSAHTYGINQTHLTDALANAAMLMHLAGAALGLGSQHVTIQIEAPFKALLGVPDPLKLVLIMPFGYPEFAPYPGSRRSLDQMVHHERYDMSKFITNEGIIKYLYDLRGLTVPIYRQGYTGTDALDKGDKA
jgi:nitroreductase